VKYTLYTTAVIAVLVVLGCCVFIYSGVYNVAASRADNAIMQWVLQTVREQSIERRAKNVRVPDESVLNDPKTIRTGFEHYDEMCVGCHGASGVEPGELREGMNPEPPLLAEHAGDISLRELFWVIKHGIKMTGMPAWGVTHSDDKIWAMAAFVKKLPEYNALDYQEMRQQTAGSE
jgi:mono/diheme cytochrome c family protein